MISPRARGSRSGERGTCFGDRRDAGRRLAASLQRYRRRSDVLVLGLPRGGVPVAFEVASALGVMLDVFIVRKLGLPGHEELALGAIAAGGVRVINEGLVSELEIPESVLDRAAEREALEIERREALYRAGMAPLHVDGRVVILVDDGLATGATMRAAVAALHEQEPSRIVVAAPIGSFTACSSMREVADEVVCVEAREPFHAVGFWYEDFAQTTDEEVRELLASAREVRSR